MLWISAFIGGKDFKQSQSCNPELGLLAFVSYFVLKGIHFFNSTFKSSHSFHQDNFKKFQEKNSVAPEILSPWQNQNYLNELSFQGACAILTNPDKRLVQGLSVAALSTHLFNYLSVHPMPMCA